MRSTPARPERSLGVALLAAALAAIAAPACKERLAAPQAALHGADAAPRDGGTLRLAALADVRSLDPAGPLDRPRDVERVVVEDRYVVAFRLKQADATFLSRLAMPTLRPTCKSAGRRYSDTWAPCRAATRPGRA